MKKKFCFLLVLVVFCQLTILRGQASLTDYVNPFIGTGGHGHTFPGAVMPFGMVQLSPDTRLAGWDGCSGYHYSDSVIYGFSHTHLSGTGVPDYCDILLMPTVGEPQLNALVNKSFAKGYASHFSHKNESASPGFYSVLLDDDQINAELTVTPRVGFHKYSFPETSQANIILDLTHRDKVLESYIRVIDSRRIEGYRRSEGWAQNQVVYFYAEFSKQIESFGLERNDSMMSDVTEARATSVKSYFQFKANKGEAIYVKLALSQVSMEGAQNNMRECLTWDFESVKRNAAATWNHELGKIEVRDTDTERKKIFYSALYHCMIHPSLASDVDGRYRGRDFQIYKTEPGRSYYTVFSLWDTYRALHPLLTILDEKRTADFIFTFLKQYEQGGRLPVWELSSNETYCMIGYHSVSVIADAAVKGIRFDYDKAVAAMKTSAEWDDEGLHALRRQGYVSSENDDESVSKTLEYAYDDWCIAQVAKLAGDSASYLQFIQRAQNWKNTFDWNRGFMRPKMNGGWHSPFDPFEVNHHYTEGNAWQYNFAVPQDIDGLIEMMGGRKVFESRLDSLFTVSSKTSGLQLPDVSGLIGQYAHGNEPSHHMAYLFSYCGAAWKTQTQVRQIANEMYHNAPDGLCGNEDCGQMSAWYVMSAMGFYPVTPGFPYYTIGSPMFDTVIIHLENQKTFSLVTANNSDQSPYVASLTLNGVPINSLMLSHASIQQGGQLQVRMSAEKNATLQADAFKPSLEISKNLIAVDPVISAGSSTFTDSLRIAFVQYYNSNLTTELKTECNPSPRFDSDSREAIIHKTTSVSAQSISSGGTSSGVVTAVFSKTNKNWSVMYVTPYNNQYTGGGNLCLTDERAGGLNFKDGSWQGWWGNDMEVVIDLQRVLSVSSVSAEFLQDQRSWILMPASLEVELSSDGKKFAPMGKSKSTISERDEKPQTEKLTVSAKASKARYVKIRAHNFGKLPAWHLSAGQPAWIFCDEVFVE